MSASAKVCCVFCGREFAKIHHLIHHQEYISIPLWARAIRARLLRRMNEYRDSGDIGLKPSHQRPDLWDRKQKP